VDPVQALRQIAFELERGGAHTRMWSFSANETGGRSSQLPVVLLNRESSRARAGEFASSADAACMLIGCHVCGFFSEKSSDYHPCILRYTAEG
jgi:hypothetical protein